MRKILMIAGVAAMAISMPAAAKDKGGNGHGGGKPEKHQSRGNGGGKANKADFRGGGNGNKSAERSRKQAEKRFDQRQRFAEKRNESRAKQAEKRFERRQKVAEKAEKRFEKRQERRWKDAERRAGRFVGRDDRRDDRRDLRRIRGDDRFDDRRDLRDRAYYAHRYDCPPGLARKNNGCLPPGQAKKLFRSERAFRTGQVLPAAWFGDYNVPYEYQSWYRDTPDTYYRYDDGGYIYRVDRGSNLIESLIPLLGGGFGVGQLLPAGYDTYNLPMAYRDDYVDSGDAWYRYGDDAIYQVDPQTSMIESIVALLAGDLNVGGLLPGGYDTYNLPLDYRDQYVDSDEAMYRYADGNIYQIDPQSMIIEQIVASLV